MSTKIFADLGVKKPDITHNLTVRTHGGMTGKILEHVEKAIVETKPDFVNVYGDTNSPLAGALAASKLHVPVIHIEAGLRSFNEKMPEEINRILTDHVSDYLFCPTSEAAKNLKSENIIPVFITSEILCTTQSRFLKKFQFPWMIKLENNKKLTVMTVHRAYTISDPLRLNQLIRYCDNFINDYQVIYPVHPNTKNKLKEFSIDLGNIDFVEPVPYPGMQRLLRESELVSTDSTDSGGLQKEAYFYNSDCITIREETEWVETINAGWNRFWNSSADQIQKKRS